jgi:hypothetical protein
MELFGLTNNSMGGPMRGKEIVDPGAHGKLWGLFKDYL